MVHNIDSEIIVGPCRARDIHVGHDHNNIIIDHMLVYYTAQVSSSDQFHAHDSWIHAEIVYNILYMSIHGNSCTVTILMYMYMYSGVH